jgi:Tfp pilus assembly protein PilF
VARAWIAILGLALGLFGQQKPKEAEPPEEDESAISKPAKEYVFNPLQAEKEIQVGVFYTKRGAWKSAKLRFEEATKWNPTSAEAWRRLAEANERLKDDKAAREAWAKYLELAPDGKYAAQARRKLGSKK